MNETIDYQHKPALLKAKTKLKILESIPDSQWNSIPADTQVQTFTDCNEISTIRVVKDFDSTRGNLGSLQACLSNIEFHSVWCPWLQNIKLLDQPSARINLIQASIVLDKFTSNELVLVEKMTRKRDSIQFISITTSSNDCYFMAYSLTSTRAIIYYQWDKSVSITYTSSVLSKALQELIDLKPFSWISRYDLNTIQCSYKNQSRDQLEAEYIYQQENESISGIDIQQGSSVKRTKFLSSSLVNTSSPQFHSTSRASFPEKMIRWDTEDLLDTTCRLNNHRDKLRLQVKDKFNLTILLPQNESLSDRFAQLCVACYRRLSNNDYVIQIAHPQRLVHYLNDLSGPIHVHLLIKKSENGQCLVNNREWPIRSWSLSSDEDESEDDESQDDKNALSEEEKEDDIFVDGMEDITTKPTTSSIIQKDTQHIPIITTPFPTISDQLELPSLSLTKDIDHQDILHTILPEHDPTALQKIYPQFADYLQPVSSSTIIQSPDRENGNVTIKKLDITNHPMGGYLSESIWKDCSIWDIKSVLESAGARKIWDNTFESTTFLHALTPTSSLWHTKIKGAWPINPRDYVCFHGQYSAGSHRIDLLSTSCFGDTYQYKPLPAKEIPGYTRATVDAMGWRLERIDDKTVSVKQVMVTQFSTWVIGFITSRFLVQTCAAVQSARDYLQTHGAPPSLENLTCALLVNVKHDHERKNWRCEYTRRISNVENNDADTAIKKAAVTNHSAPSTVSLIRLDKRRWATNNQYAIVIDPPPSRVSAIEKVDDPYGVWLTIEHDEAFIIPLRGKILVLIKPEQVTKSPLNTTNDCQLNVNGVTTTIQIEERKMTPTIERSKQASFSQHFIKEELEQLKHELKDSTFDTTSTPEATPCLSEDEKILAALNQSSVSPKEHAQASLTFLKQTDEQFGWTVLSDNKSGMRISKKSGTKNSNVTTNNKKADDKDSAVETTNSNHVLQVFEPYMVYKGSKVIENFSVDEVSAVVSDIGYVRKVYDDTIERGEIDLVHQTLDPGCRVIRQSIKALFPFKNREVYAVSCLAQEPSSTTSTKRTFYIESSLPDFPTINSKKTRGHLFISGWILEAIDPYNTTTVNHPIPSMRATYVAALDLGNAVPSYISNLVANNWFPKKIHAVESYLKTKGPPPFITQPNPALIFANNTLSASAARDMSWTCINPNYDDQHRFKMTSQFKMVEEIKVETTKKKTKKEDILVLSPSTSSSTSTSTSTATAPPYRRPSNHTISSDPDSRRGSLQTSALPKKGLMTVVSSIHAPAPTKSSGTDRFHTILQVTFDLRDYPKGYEIQSQLYHILKDSDHRKNISNKLVLYISEPSLPHLMDGKKKLVKHCVVVTAQGLAVSSLYEFEFSLAPVHEETISSLGQKLTVSHVLGADEEEEQVKDTWRGLIIVNGTEAVLNKDLQLKSLQPEETMIEDATSSKDAFPISDGNKLDLTGISDREITTDASLNSNTNNVEDGDAGQKGIQYMGGGVVAAALGNVSAGVNNFGARMMIPFRAASFSLSSSNNEPLPRIEEPPTLVAETSDDDDDTIEGVRRTRFTKDEKQMINSSSAGTTLHEIRMLRRSSDTMRKGMLLLMICIALAVVFALLMLQPMMERYYASFSVSSSVNVLEKSIEEGIVHRLLQIPWLGGWDIQVIAVRRQ